ncbi:MAG: hypothetical protein ACREEM_34080 [Blastocatellia bacterium]
MKQTTNYLTHGGSASAAGVFSELVIGAITGMGAVRSFFYRAMLLVAIVAAAIAFTVGVKIRDYMPVSAAQGAISTPEPTRDRQSKPPPKHDRDAEEIQRLIRKDPL